MAENRRYQRFPASYRAEHWVLMLSFTILAVTGLVQLFAQVSLSRSIVAALGGIESVRLIHRASAIALMLLSVYHLGAVGYRFLVLRYRPSILPTMLDVRNAWDSVLYYLGRREHRPQQDRYTYEEKAEYWAVVWGTVIMMITGFMLWNPIATARFLPGQFIPAAKAAHGGEALLAVLAIIVWHLYHVHIRHFNRSMFTGYLSEEEMLEEHPLELADRKAGVYVQAPNPEHIRRRQRIFIPVYTVIAVGLVAGIYFFATFEQTAILTVPPPEQVVVFAPFTPTPVPTALPTVTPAADAQTPTSWETGFAELLAARCGSCHGGSVMLGGLDLSTYAAALEGGQGGPAIVPGDPDASLLLEVQAVGNHPGQLSGDELALLRSWIESEAPEQ